MFIIVERRVLVIVFIFSKAKWIVSKDTLTEQKGPRSVLKWKPGLKKFNTTVECRVGNESSHIHLNYVHYSECASMNYSCRWTGDPEKANFTWFLNGAVLSSCSKQYLIRDHDEFASITCEVENETGKQSLEVERYCKYMRVASLARHA